MAEHLTVSEVARHLGCRPRDISDLFYKRYLADDACPIVGGRRLIPNHLLSTIKAVLAERTALRMRQLAMLGSSAVPPDETAFTLLGVRNWTCQLSKANGRPAPRH